MKMRELTIDRLSLHLSGFSDGDGKHLAQLITSQLASTSLVQPVLKDDHIRLDVVAQAGASIRSLAEQIVSDLVRQLDRTL